MESQGAADMQTDGAQEMLFIQQADYFKFTAQRMEVGPGNRRGPNGSRRHSHAKFQTSAEQEPECSVEPLAESPALLPEASPLHPPAKTNPNAAPPLVVTRTVLEERPHNGLRPSTVESFGVVSSVMFEKQPVANRTSPAEDEQEQPPSSATASQAGSLEQAEATPAGGTRKAEVTDSDNEEAQGRNNGDAHPAAADGGRGKWERESQAALVAGQTTEVTQGPAPAQGKGPKVKAIEGVDELKGAIQALHFKSGRGKDGRKIDSKNKDPSGGGPLAAAANNTTPLELQGACIKVLIVLNNWRYGDPKDNFVRGTFSGGSFWDVTCFCHYASDLPPPESLPIYRALLWAGLLDLVDVALARPQCATWKAVIAMLTWSLLRHPSLLQEHLSYFRHLLRSHQVIYRLLDRHPRSCGLQAHLWIFWRDILELREADDYSWLDPLLEDVIQQLLAVLDNDASTVAGCTSEPRDGLVHTEEYMRKSAFAILGLSLSDYAAVRPIFLKYNALESLMRLVARRPEVYAEDGIKFMGTCLNRGGPQFLTRIVHGDLLAPALAAYFAKLETGVPFAEPSADFTAVVELILERNLTEIIRYLWERIGQDYQKVDHLAVFQRLHEAYERIAADGDGVL